MGLGRRKYHALNQMRKAIIIEKHYRRYYCLSIYQKKKKSALIIQCAVRSHFARKELKALKLAAKDLANMANEKEKLKQQRVQLLAKLEAMKAAKLEAEKSAKALREITSEDVQELNRLREEAKDLNSELAESQTKLQQEMKRADDATEDVKKINIEMATLQQALEKLKEQLDTVSEDASSKASE